MVAVQVAITAGVDLNSRHASGGNFVRIDCGRCRVPFNNADLKFWRQRLDGFQNETGFPAPGGGHQIDRGDLMLIELDRY